jgi:hypothetical protein
VSVRVAVAAAVGDGPPVADPVAVGTGDAVAVGAGDAPLSVAQAFVSWDSTERQTDRAVGSHAVPSVAVRETATRMNG